MAAPLNAKQEALNANTVMGVINSMPRSVESIKHALPELQKAIAFYQPPHFNRHRETEIDYFAAAKIALRPLPAGASSKPPRFQRRSDELLNASSASSQMPFSSFYDQFLFMLDIRTTRITTPSQSFLLVYAPPR